MGKRLLALLLAACLMFSGCQMQKGTIGNIRTHRTINIAISRELSHLREIITEGLVRPLRKVSNSAFEINLRVTDNPLKSLDEGDDLVIMSNAEAALANADFSAYTSPYYFRDYDHFTITLGHQDFASLTEEANLALLGAKPIGALYGGGYTFFSGKDEPIGELEGLKNNRIGILPDNSFLEALFEDLGSRMVIKTTEELLSGFANRTLPVIELSNQDVAGLRMPDKISQIYYNETFHRLDINWVMMSNKSLSTFSEWEIAVILEGVASLVAYNDSVLLERENKAFEEMRAGCNAVAEPVAYEDFSLLVETVLRRSYRYHNLWDWDNYSTIKSIC